MMNSNCRCKYCVNPRIEFYKEPDEDLINLALTRDDRHKLARVSAYIELFYRAGVFSPVMPYIVWRYVIGPHIPPPVTATGFGAFSSHYVMPQHDYHGYH